MVNTNVPHLEPDSTEVHVGIVLLCVLVSSKSMKQRISVVMLQ
jgi:hypothetical protein